MCISFQTIRCSSEKQSAVVSVFSMTSVGMAVTINCGNDIIRYGDYNKLRYYDCIIGEIIP